MTTPKTVRLTVLASAGLTLVALFFWSDCGQVSQDSQPVAEQAVPPIEAVPMAEEVIEAAPIAPFAGEPAEELAVAVAVPVAAPVARAEPVVDAPVPVVAAPPPAPVKAVRRRSEPLPTVSAPALEPVPEQDLLIADAASARFTPEVAALALAGLGVGAPIQGDDNSLNVLQPCDTAASGCAAGLAPGQVIGAANDWTGFVLPGF